MKFGIVTGRITFSRVDPAIADTRFLIVEPVTAENLAARNGKGGGRELIAADQMGPRMGQMVGYVEGREGAAPWHPRRAPVDAYISLIVEGVDYHPPTRKGKQDGQRI